MAEGTVPVRLSKAASEFNVGVGTIIEFLHKKGFKIDNNPNSKLTPEMYTLLVKEYQPDKAAKEVSKKIELEYTHHQQNADTQDRKVKVSTEDDEPVVVIKTTKVEPATPALVITPKVEAAVPPPLPEPAVVKPVEIPAEPEPVVPEIPAPVIVVAETAPETPKEIIEIPVVEKETVAEKVEEKVEVAQEPVIIEPEKPEVEIKTTGGLKVIGKIELPVKGHKHKKGKEEPGKEIPVPVPAPAPVEVKVEIVEEVIEEKPETPVPAIVPTPEVPVENKQVDQYAKTEANFITTKIPKLEGPKILNKIVLPTAPAPKSKEDHKKQPVASSSDDASLSNKKKKRKRLKAKAATANDGNNQQQQQPANAAGHDKHKGGHNKDNRRTPRVELKPELTEEEIQKQIKETLQRLAGTGKSKASKYRREKRQAFSAQVEEEQARLEEEKKVIKVTEFVTANDLSTMMDVPVTQIIATCMAVGVFASINQRLDAETISLVAEEFGYKVEFVSVEVQEAIEGEEDNEGPDDTPRPPIVTVMGHVDHGKTSLLDYIRNANVIAGEAGGITQHIGAYEVQLQDGRKITFLDTPGHEAFTAMRARGAKVTDIVIIVVAADDTVMPQTIEAINHAQAAGSPMVFAINKIDKPTANTEKIKEELSKLNILVEDWGGKFQSQEISAKKGTNVELLLEKVLLEAELLDLKGNPNRKALGTVIESSLDKGRGYIAKLLVQNGTLKVGDILVAGSIYGKVKAMYNERNQAIKSAGPSSPVLLLGLSGAPQAGDKFNVMNDEREAKQIATKRQQLQREQGIRTQKHITLDEIGRRIAIGDFKELNIIVKGDVDGSVEALSDSLLKLGNNQVQVNVIHKSVGAITESDVLLASASNAVIVGFQVRPSMSARRLAEREEIDIRLYSIIYNAINEIKDAIEGMLSPEIQEKITCNVEIREVFRITKVGSVAGCMVLDGKITRNTRIRLIRDGIVVYTGTLGSLKRFKDDAKEVATGYECGLNIENFNDIKVGDIIEGFEEVEVKRKL